MLLTTLLFVLVTAIVRFIGDGIPASQAAFIRYVIGTIILLPFIKWNGVGFQQQSSKR